MFKQSAHRNQRTKGSKVKHVVQLCFLVGVCIWLLYQVQHSRGKNTSDRENTKISDKIKGGNEILNLGRKNLHPRTNGDTEPRLHDGDTTEDTAGKETSESVDGAKEGTKQEDMKGEDKGDAGDMENDDRNRRGEKNANEKGYKENHDQENGGDEGNVKGNKDQEMPEENESKEATEEKHVDENNSKKLQEKGTEENEVVQEGKSTEQSSGRGSSEDGKEEGGLSRSMEDRNKKSEIEFDGTTDGSNEVEKEDAPTGENSANITETEKVSLVDFIEEEKSNNSTIASIDSQNNTSGLSSENKELSALDDQVDSSVSALPQEEGTEANSHDAVAK